MSCSICWTSCLEHKQRDIDFDRSVVRGCRTKRCNVWVLRFVRLRLNKTLCVSGAPNLIDQLRSYRCIPTLRFERQAGCSMRHFPKVIRKRLEWHPLMNSYCRWNYRQISNVSCTSVSITIVDNSNVVRASPACPNYIFILDLTAGFNWLGKDTCKTRR